jgi:hypothetical protein
MKRKKYVKIYLFITMIEKGGRVNESKIGTEDILKAIIQGRRIIRTCSHLYCRFLL